MRISRRAGAQSRSLRRTIARLGLSAALCAALLFPAAASADGALALGQPPDPADGIAYGTSYDVSPAEAQAEALENCRTAGASQEATSLCRVVANFRRQCLAIASDPGDGTPGFGWSLGPDKQSASRDAMNKCVATAGPGRREFCKVETAECDEEN